MLVDLLFLSYPVLAVTTTLRYRLLLVTVWDNNVPTVIQTIKHSKTVATITVNKKYLWHHCMYKCIHKAVTLGISLPNYLKFAHCVLQ